MNYAVVIPSKSWNNVVHCVQSIGKCEPMLPQEQIIVVDDGVQWPMNPWDLSYMVISGEKPFVFARNCNIGIKYALSQCVDGVILLNDDAQLKTDGGFSRLHEVATSNTAYGVIAAETNSAGNPNQLQRGSETLREEKRMVCFVCVYIPRRTIETVGYLDERYVHYGMDDDDYCFMCRAAGMKIGVYGGCFVDHLSLTSSYRGDPRTASDFRPNMQLFIDKWGTDNWGVPGVEARKKWAVVS